MSAQDFSKATPRPWAGAPSEWRKKGGDWRYEDDNGNPVSCLRPTPNSPVEETIAEFWGTEHDDAANAAFALHAVNNHDALVEALALARREIADMAGSAWPGVDYTKWPVIQQIDALLSSTGGEGK